MSNSAHYSLCLWTSQRYLTLSVVLDCLKSFSILDTLITCQHSNCSPCKHEGNSVVSWLQVKKISCLLWCQERLLYFPQLCLTCFQHYCTLLFIIVSALTSHLLQLKLLQSQLRLCISVQGLGSAFTSMNIFGCRAGHVQRLHIEVNFNTCNYVTNVVFFTETFRSSVP